MTDLGDISEKLAVVVDRTENIGIDIRDIKEDIMDLKQQLVDANANLRFADKRISSTNNSIREIKKTVERHEALKNGGLAVFGFISFMFGAFGSFFGKHIGGS